MQEENLLKIYNKDIEKLISKLTSCFGRWLPCYDNLCPLFRRCYLTSRKNLIRSFVWGEMPPFLFRKILRHMTIIFKQRKSIGGV